MEHKEIKRIENKKILYALLIVFAVIILISASVFAAFLRKTDNVKNTFSPAVSQLPEVQEVFTDNVKKDVKISVGQTNYPVYVRVALMFNWQEKDNKNGAIHFGELKDGTDYTLDINDADWMYKDGYYYYKYPVKSDGVTNTLIKKSEPIGSNTPDGYALSVNILVQTVQAVGHTDVDSATSVTALKDAWGVDLE